MNKINDLQILINDSDPDLILITETWCNEDISNAMLNVTGYFIEPESEEVYWFMQKRI